MKIRTPIQDNYFLVDFLCGIGNNTESSHIEPYFAADTRLGRFGTPCIIQLFLGTPLIDIHEKLHSSSQNSKTRAGAGLDDINMDQSETRHIRSGF